MNVSSLFGLLMALSIAIGAAATATKNWKVFLDWHAMLIVVGGTIAASLISFSGPKLVGLFKVFFVKVLGRQQEIKVAFNEIVDLAKGYRENEKYLKDKVGTLKCHFLREAIELMVKGGIDPAELDGILRMRADAIHHRHEQDAEMFKALSKFPPAFGLMGAVMGMIAMMQNLGGADAMASVGPSLAVALVATLYGIAIANFIFLPLGENLHKLNKMDSIIRKMVLYGVKLIRMKKHPLVVEESILSLILPSEREPLRKKKAS